MLARIQKDGEDPKKKSKYTISENFFYKEARELFVNPDVIREKELLEPMIKWNKPDEEALKEFLVGSKGFSEVKVENGVKKLKTMSTKAN